jgi:TolB-like protein/tetratricopeptide (TPR) repeat protein
MPLSPGHRLGPYELLERIGTGGMGEVYRATDTRLGRLVAVKVQNNEHSDRFVQEARAIAALNHPHICQIHDVGPNYLVLEYIEGETLASRLAQRPPLSPEQILRLAVQIASALEAAHRNGILHRDLKPANVMVVDAKDGRPGRLTAKLLDFGLARPADPNADTTRTAPGTIVGTAAYMSPEQADGRPVDRRTDIFSFGAVLYEMLSGRRAFEGETMLEVLSAVMRVDPPPLRATAGLDQVIQQCLAKDPRRRFQSMAEVHAALEGVAQQRVEIAAGGAQPTLAVLPFANLSADRQYEYFSEGLAEDLLETLRRVPGLIVTERTSAFAFRGERKEPRRIGERLGVRMLLDGSVRRAGNRIRVAVELIDARDGGRVWSERYDRDVADVVNVRAAIVEGIADRLRVGSALEIGGQRRHPVGVAAYDAWLRGLYHLHKTSQSDAARSQAAFEEVATRDPGFAPGHAALANSLLAAGSAGYKPVHEALPLIKAAAIRAVTLDPMNAEGHQALATVAGLYEYRWPEALDRCQLALGCDSVSADVRQAAADDTLLPLRRADEALAALQPALTSDPLAPDVRASVAEALFARGSHQGAIDELTRTLALDDSYAPAHVRLGRVDLAIGKTAEASRELERALQLAPWQPEIFGLLAGLHRQSGDKASAERFLVRLSKIPNTPMKAVGEATYQVLAADFERAAQRLDSMIEARGMVARLVTSPLFEAFRASDHGRRILQRINLAEVW